MFFQFPTSKASTSSRTTCGCRSCAIKGLCFAPVDRRHGAARWPCSITRGLNYGVDFKGGSLHRGAVQGGPGRHRRPARQARQARPRRRADPELRRRHRRADPRRAAARRDAEQQVPLKKVRTRWASSTRSAASRWSARRSRASSSAPASSPSSPSCSASCVYVWFRFEWQFARRRHRGADARRAGDGRASSRCSSSSSTCRSSRRC